MSQLNLPIPTILAFALLLLVSVMVAVTLSLTRGRPTAASAVGLVASVVVAAALALWYHFGMKIRTEQFLDSNDSNNVSASIVSLRRKKTDVLLPAIAPFFCSGSKKSIQLSATSFRVFWQPSVGDLRGEFVTRDPKKSTWTIDDVSCIDRTSKLPARALTQLPPDAELRDAPEAKDCRVYIDDGTYQMQKRVISTWCEFVPRSNLLRMKPGDIGTQTLMLLRPCLVRVGGTAHRLYRVDYSMPGTNGAAYDSGSADPYATLRLQDGSRWDEEGTFAAPGPGVHPIVCYYLSYDMPRAAFAGNPNKLMHSASAIVSGFTTDAAPRASSVHGYVQNQKQKRAIMTLAVERDVATITTQGQVFKMPAGLSATVATVTDDCVVAAAISPDRVSVRRFQPLTTRCAFTLADERDSEAPAADTAPALVRKLPRFSATCIPNLADLASRIQGVADSAVTMIGLDVTTVARTASPLARNMFTTPDPPPPSSNTLEASPHQSLPAGSHITSANGLHALAYTQRGDLVVTPAATVNELAPRPTWSSKTGAVLAKSGAGAGLCALDAFTGVLTLHDARGEVYWRSSNRPLPSAAQPYRAIISDKGAVEVWGRFGRGAYWTRGGQGGGDSGYAWFGTCELASDAYGEENADAIEEATLGGRISVTPWMHYDNRGGRDVLGLHWPGPPC
jgi:hypothetical protein